MNRAGWFTGGSTLVRGTSRSEENRHETTVCEGARECSKFDPRAFLGGFRSILTIYCPFFAITEIIIDIF